MIPPAVAAFRERRRADFIGPRYSGRLHFAFTSTLALAAVALCVVLVRAPSAWELLVVPATFLYANFVEYRFHRGPMHHRTRGISFAFERHTVSHHHYYTHEAMSIESHRDLKLVLFPPAIILVLMGGAALPVGLLLALVTTKNVAFLFAATALGYFLSYEWLHLAYHLPETSWVGRLPGMARLRRHHLAHHDPALMQKWNFNITFPICDVLYRTTYRV